LTCAKPNHTNKTHTQTPKKKRKKKKKKNKKKPKKKKHPTPHHPKKKKKTQQKREKKKKTQKQKPKTKPKKKKPGGGKKMKTLHLTTNLKQTESFWIVLAVRQGLVRGARSMVLRGTPSRRRCRIAELRGGGGSESDVDKARD